MNLNKKIFITSVILLTGCASSIKDLGNGRFSTFGYGVSGASKNSAVNKANEFCLTQKKIPYVFKEFRDEDDNYRMNFSCEDKKTVERLERENLEAEKRAEINRRSQISKDYPFEAIVDCRFRGNNASASLPNCTSDDRQDANFFVINGGANKKGINVTPLPGAYKLTRGDMSYLSEDDGVHIFLKNNYHINVPNLSQDYIVVLTIKRTNTGEVIENKAAAFLQTAISKR